MNTRVRAWAAVLALVLAAAVQPACSRGSSTAPSTSSSVTGLSLPVLPTTLLECLNPVGGLGERCVRGTWIGTYVVNGTPGTLSWTIGDLTGDHNGSFSGSVPPMQTGDVNMSVASPPANTAATGSDATFYHVVCPPAFLPVPPPGVPANPLDKEYTVFGHWNVAGRNSINGTGNTGTLPIACGLTVWAIGFELVLQPPATPQNPTVVDQGSSAPQREVGPTLAWTGSQDAWYYELKYGTTNPPPLVHRTTATSVQMPFMTGSRFWWQVSAVNGAGATDGPISTFTIGS